MPLTELFRSAPGFDASRRCASRRERLFAAVTAALMFGLAALFMQHRAELIPISPDAAIVYAVLVWIAQALTAGLLVLRARLAKDAGSAILAGGFLFAAVCATLALATHRGVGLMPRAEIAIWARYLERLGVVVGIGLYALARSDAPARLGRTLLVAGLASLGALGVALRVGGPHGFRLVGPHGEFSLPYDLLAGLLLGVVAAAAAALLRRARRASSLDVWLGVALVAMAAFVVEVLAGGARSTVATFDGWLFSVVESFVVLGALLTEFTRLFVFGRTLDQFRAIAELSGTIVILLDRDGEWLYVNERWAETTGQPVVAALGVGWQAHVHPEDLDSDRERWAREASADGPQRLELRLRARGGIYRWHSASITPIRRAPGPILGFYGTLLDVDVQQRAHEEVEMLYARERRISRALQAAFLPPFLPEVPGVALHAHYRPASREAQVGGDWYDAFLLRDGRIALSIGDVFGHGLDAAGVMIRLRETVRAVTGVVDDDPATILRLTNRTLVSTHPEAIATAVVALFDPATGRVVLACAGHPPPVIVSAGRPALLTYGGLPLGVEPDGRFSLCEAFLKRGDALVLYTDGLLESERDLIGGERRLLDALAAHPDDADAVVAELLGEHQRDDVAFLRLQVTGVAVTSSWRFVSDDALSAHDARRSFTVHLQRRNADPATIAAAELAFGELVGNVVRHAPGPIEIELAWESETPVLMVRDRGPRFAPGAGRLPANPFAEGGRGLFIIGTFASPPLVVPRPGGGNEVVVRLASGALVPSGAGMV